MMIFVWILLGAIASAPIWMLLTLWVSRRAWKSTRRLVARARGKWQLAELGQLAGGLAHEIKNPLSTINVNLQLLSEDLAHEDDEKHRRWLRRLTSVQEEADRMRGILEDFLQYARKYEIQLEPIDLRKLVEELTDFFTPQAEANHVLLRTSIPDEPIVCEADENLFKQAVLNLIINAVQAMDKGGELLIRVSIRRGRADLEIIDTGPGIAPETLEKLFDVYFSTKRGGCGLGLPTTRKIVREHNGRITAESEPGKGTRFVITLPLSKRRPSQE